MPDLDLIKQGYQGCRRFGKTDPSVSTGQRGLQPTRAILLLICCRSSQRLGLASTIACNPPRLLGVRPTPIQILPGCLVVGDTAEEAPEAGIARQPRAPRQ